MKNIMMLLVVWSVFVGTVWAEMDRVSATEMVKQTTRENSSYGKL